MHTTTAAGRTLVAGLIALVVCGFGTSAWAQNPAPSAGIAAEETFALVDTSPERAGKPTPLPPAERFGVELGRVPEVRLGALDVEKLLAEDALARPEKGGQRYAIGRAVEVLPALGSWFDLPGGAKLWVAELSADGATSLRLHFASLALPEGAELAVYAPQDERDGFFKSPGVAHLDRPIQVFSAQSTADLWTGSFPGERVRLELLLPKGGASAELPFAIDQLLHAYSDPVAKAFESLKAAGPCHNDVTCFPDWGATARGVARFSFVSGGSGFLCTGQLLNNQKQDFTPFFLTANHCVNTGSEAASTEFFWLYQTATCGGAPPNVSSVPRSFGATLMSANGLSDYSLLQIEGALPGGLTWVGWTSANQGVGTPSTAIHHPSGDFKRISFGVRSGANSCGSFGSSNNFVQIDWTDAPTEPGSSGGGIFRSATQQLFGTLTGGPSACFNETFDCYGSFVSTFAKIKNTLKKGGSDDNSEQNDTCNKAKNAKKGTLANRIVKNVDVDWYKIAVPKGKTVTITLNFIHDNGDIDLEFHGNCVSGPLGSSLSTTNQEVLAFTNTGNNTQTALWRVFLDSDTRNNYNMTVSVN
jgi:S1-C subfamily serine protease